MDTVTIDGVEYVKASVLARQHGYTADYVGQLCRSNKVDAHLVGRTWYVYPPALDSHKSTRYAELRSNDKSAVGTIKTTLSRRSVIAPTAKKTSRAQSANFSQRVFWKKPEYDIDESDLLPALSKHEESLRSEMKVKLADSHRVTIASRSNNVTLVSEPPPAIALAGTLKVQAYEPRFEDVPELDAAAEKLDTYSYVGGPMSIKRDASDDPDRVDAVKVVKDNALEEAVTYNVPLRKQVVNHAPLSFTPQSIRRPVTVKNEALVDRKEPKLPVLSHVQEKAEADPAHSLFFNLVVAPAVVLLVVVVAGSFLFLESQTQVSAEGGQVRVFSLSATSLGSLFVPE